MDILSMILSRNQSNFTTTTESVRTILTGAMVDNMYQHSEAIQLVEGQEYTIVLSNETGELVIGTYVAKNGPMMYIGNLSLFFGDEVENTEEVFCVIADTSNNATMVICQAANGTKFIIRTKEKKTVIRSELIPGAVLPVVEITSSVEESFQTSVQLSEAEATALTKSAKTKHPCVMYFTTLDLSAVAMYTQGGFSADISIAKISFLTNETGWEMSAGV